MIKRLISLPLNNKSITVYAFFLAAFFFSSVSSSAVGDNLSDELKGAELVKQKCSECHQHDGNSTDSTIPKIAGFSTTLIYDTLEQFKSEYRSAKSVKTKSGETTDMVKISKQLSDQQIDTLAAYFAKQTFTPAVQDSKTVLIEIGKQLHLDLCNDCHIDLGRGVEDDAPILSGQWKPYLTEQFKNFSSGERRMPRRMKQKFRKLNEDDKMAIIEFYSSRVDQPESTNPTSTKTENTDKE